jgi:hypothetical protein
VSTPAPTFANIKGKSYETVASRIKRFRADHPHGSITTGLVANEKTVICHAAVSIPVADHSLNSTTGEPAMMMNHLADGWAEEDRGSSQINDTSAVENCETSAIGRALGIAGWDASGTSVASADEVANAIHQQAEPARSFSQPQQPSSTQPSGKQSNVYTPTQVEAVELKRKSDGKPFSKYVIHTGDGIKLTTLNQGMAEAATSAINQGCDVEAVHLPANRWGDCDLKEITIQTLAADPVQEEDLPF